METPLARAHLAQTGHTDGTERQVYLAKTSERQRDELFNFLRKESEPVMPKITEELEGDGANEVLNSTMKSTIHEISEQNLPISPIKAAAPSRPKADAHFKTPKAAAKRKSDLIDDSTFQPGSAEKKTKTYCRRWSGRRPDPKDFDEEDRMRQNFIEHLYCFRKEQSWTEEEKRCLKYFENVVKSPTLDSVKTLLTVNGKELSPDSIGKIYKKLQNCDQYLTFEYYERQQVA